MSKNFKIIFSWALLIGWMIFIYYMSAQPADISNSQSGFVIKILQDLGINSNGSNTEILTTIVRKGSHFTEYAVLGVLVYNLIRNYLVSKKARIIAIGVVFLYACSDEFHQIFVPGRAGRLTDVIIDTSGGIFSTIIIWILNMKNRFLSRKDIK